ncbi:MAG: arylesterase [Vulcanimicrobiota bacterium]
MQRRILVFVCLLFLVGCHHEVAHLNRSEGPVVILGDSLAAGTGAAPGEGFVDLLEQRLGVEIVNRGVPGNTTAQGLARLERDVLRLKPALVIVELGGNDVLQKVDPQQTFANLEKIIEAIQANDVPVLLLGIRGGLVKDRFASEFRRLARAKQAALVENIMEGVLTQPGLKADPIHPNAAGYRVLADRVEPTLKRLLQQIGKLPEGE